MPKKYPPLTPQQVVSILKARGFTLDNQVGSHANYVGIIGGKRRRVTVDMSIKDFPKVLIKSMIRQSGMERDEFYCSTKDTAKRINKRKIEFVIESGLPTNPRA